MSVKFWLNLKKEVWYFILKGGGAAALRAAGGAVVQRFHKRQRKSLETRVVSSLCACCDQQAGVRAENNLTGIDHQWLSITNDEGEEGESFGGGWRSRYRGHREVVPGADRSPEPNRSAAGLQKTQQEALQMREKRWEEEESR